MTRQVPALAALLLAQAVIPSEEDPLRDFVPSDEVVEVTLPERDPGCAHPDEFVELRGIPSGQREALLRLARVAVAASELAPCEFRVEYIPQGWWKDLHFFRVGHGSCFDRMSWTIAVDDSGQKTDVSASADRPCDDSSLKAFNTLVAQHGVALRNVNEATELANFFLLVCFPRGERLYLRSRAQADEIISTRPFSDTWLDIDAGPDVWHDTLWKYDLQETPRSTVHADNDRFLAVAYSFLWWCGLIDQIDMTITPDGTISCVRVRYGEQAD